jgi:hypothetical protein
VFVEVIKRRRLFLPCESALQSDKNKTLKSRMAPSRAVQSQQTLVATPVIAMVSRPRARSKFSSYVP